MTFKSLFALRQAERPVNKWRSQHYNRSISWVRNSLGREPTTTDFNVATIRAAVGWARGNGRSETSITRFRCCFSALWEFAERRRLVTDGPPRKRRGKHLAAIVGTGNPLPPAPQIERADTLVAIYEREYRPRRLAGRSEETHKNYLINLRHFSRYLASLPDRAQGEATIADLTEENVIGAMGWTVARGRSIVTANKLRIHICAIWNFCAKRGFAKTFPDVRKFVEPERTPSAWSSAQLSRLWNACDQQTGQIGGVLANLWWRALHELAWDSGERCRALFELQWEDVDLDGRTANFRAETRKGKQKSNLVPLHRDTVATLDKFKRESGPVLPFPFCRGMIWKRYKTLLRGAGLPCKRADMLHKMRRSVASHAERVSPGVATALLKHSDRETTLKYLDPRITGQQSAIDFLPRIGTNGGAA